MLELNNSTPFAADFVLFPNEQGIETLYLLGKATFEHSDKLTLAAKQKPLCKADEYLNGPENSSLIAASDYHLSKPASDIIVLGDAVAQDEQPVTRLDVTITVGHLNKTLCVFGDRDWSGNAITSPQPFSRMPLIYERAFGADGAVLPQSEAAAVDSNPAGVGFYPGAAADESERRLPLPNIEDPHHLIQTRQDAPPAAGCGMIAPHWAGRRQYSGTYDEHWQRTRAPYLPTDFNPSFFNCASSGLVYDGFIQGGEPVQVCGMNPQGPWQFDIPYVPLQCTVNVAGRDYHPVMRAETLILEPNRKRFCMVWRAALPVAKKAMKVRSVALSLGQRTAAGAA